MDLTEPEKENKRIEEAMKIYNKVIHSNRITLLLIGIWPLDPNASTIRRTFNRLHVSIIVTAHFFLMVPQWFDMYELRGDLKSTAETLNTNIFVFPSAFKFINFLFMAREFKKILETMQSNWMEIMKLPDTKENQENKDILIDWTTKASNRCVQYGILLFLAGAAYRVHPLITGLGDPGPRDRVYPFFGRYYFDRNSDMAYVFCYAGQFVSGIIVEVTHYACDTLFSVCIYHACAQLSILQNDLVKLGQDEKYGIEREKELIRKHQHEIKNAKNLEMVFGTASCVQIMAGCVNMCNNGFKMIISLKERESDIGTYVFTLIFLLLQIFLYCFPGDQLVSQSQGVDTAIYQSNWYDLNKTAKINSGIMKIRAQKPLMVIAGKVFILSLETYMKIVKTSLSSLSVLRAMYDK